VYIPLLAYTLYYDVISAEHGIGVVKEESPTTAAAWPSWAWCAA
jgi:hypothetical protein